MSIYSSWKSWPVIVKISTVNNKSSRYRYKNLELSSWEYQSIMVKSRPVITILNLLFLYIYVVMVVHRHILNETFTITRHRNVLRVSGNEKKTNITKYFLKKKIYRYILVEYFVLNIYTKWMLLTKQKIYWLIIQKQIEKTLIISLKRAFFKSLGGQKKVNSNI